MNTLKTGVLMVLLTMTFLALGAFLGGRSGMTMALVLALGMNLGVIPDRMTRLATRQPGDV